MELTAGPVGVLGKSPAHGDFLHIRASHPAFVAFDDWLAQSFEWASERGGAAFLDAYSRGSIHAYLFHPPGGQGAPITGALGPSADAAGRKFPLIAGAMLALDQNLLRSPHILPLLLEEFWWAAGNLVAESSHRPTPDLDERSRVLATQSELDFEMAFESYRGWTEQMPLRDLWHLLDASTFGSDPVVPLKLLAEAVRPLRGIEQPKSPLSLRLPLGQAGGAALCFWLDLARRFLGWRATVPSFFWSHDGQAGGLMLNLGQPPPSTLSELWQPSGTRDEVCDLCARLDGDWVSTLPALPPRVHEVLAAEGASVADLLLATDSA
jgi:type VI secretion system ImpM family protein